MEPVRRIDAVPLFPRLHARLVELLRSLEPDDWARPTVAALWTVKDVVAHLLDGDLRRIGLHRDGWRLPPPAEPIGSWADLVRWLNAVNAEWVAAMHRVSPRVLVEMLEASGREVSALFAGLDPDAPAPFGVAWAGEDESLTWMDLAREYTERWLHQQQIRDAVGRPGVMDAELGRPYFAVSMRVLPHAFRAVDAADGTAVTVVVEGEAGGAWTVVRQEGRWMLYEGASPGPAARVTVAAGDAWRLLSKPQPPERIRALTRAEGDPALALQAFSAPAVMA